MFSTVSATVSGCAVVVTHTVPCSARLWRSWWAVASGRANHAGVGVLPSSESYGVECTGPIPVGNTGIDAFPMYASYVLGVACICEVEGWDARVVFGHKETARPDCRKPDPAFGDGCPTPYLDMNRFRAAIQAQIGVDPEEDDMTPAQAAQLAQVAKDVAELKKETVLTRPGQATMDGVWYAWRRLNHGNENGPTETLSLAGLRDQLNAIQALLEGQAPPPSG